MMKRKSLILLMMIVMCISCLAGLNAFAFSDVEEEHRHGQAITYLTDKGVINGYEDGTFKPDDTITRAEFLKMALESVNISNVYGTSAVTTGFTDVDGEITKVKEKDESGNEVEKEKLTGQHWAAGYIKLAVDKGIVSGYGDGTFAPDAPVKYEEAIKMMVCCLGRDEIAKYKAETLKLPMWPDAYISVGNDLTIAKTTDYELGALATRSNIAQMLYNVKDVKVVLPSNVIIDEGASDTKKPTTSFGGGGGDGFIGLPTLPGDGVTDSTTIVSGLITYGTVVAAVKQVNGLKKPIIIDNGIVIDNTLVETVGNNYIIMKLENAIESNNYQQFYTSGNDFSRYLGHRVEMKYRYNPDGGVSGRYEIETLSSRDTEAIYINSEDFKREKTQQKNQNSSVAYVCYTDGERDYEKSLYTDDLDTIKVIYNNKLVNVEQLRDEYLASFEGDNPPQRAEIDIITLNDILPLNGRITIVDAYMDSSIDLIWVDSYETYVVGDRSFGSTPKSITDKFRTDENGRALKLILNDDESNGDSLNIMQNNKEIRVTDIVNNSILTVAQSKCKTSTDIIAQRSSTSSIVLNSVKSVNGVKKAFVAKTGISYNLSDYYVKYVDSALDYESGDTMTLYVNSLNEVMWATVSEPTYSVGYLVSASYNETTEKINLRILTSGGQIVAYTMADNKTKFITKATECLSGVTPNSVSNPNGYLYKNLREGLIYQALCENAGIINEGKASYLVSGATVSQPIRYVLSSGTEISTLLTLEPDSANLFTGDSLKYEKDANTGRLTFSTADFSRSFSAGSAATVIFVPNNRDLTNASYKIGTASSLSSKFIEYMQYNIEPYFVTSASGDKSRNVFVVYNESIDAIPTYRSDNIIVTSIEETQPGDTTTFLVKGYVASNSTQKTYTCYSRNILNSAQVLDSNFERTGQVRAVEVGDVIRIGVSPIGAIASVDLILDISADQKENADKIVAVSAQSELLNIPPNKNYVHYYTRIGEITHIDSSETPESCTVTINGTPSMISIGPGFSSKQILLYDHTAVDEPVTEKDDRLKIITMDELWGGEVLFVWQGPSMIYKQIYAVRYPVQQQPADPPQTGGSTDESGSESESGTGLETGTNPGDSSDTTSEPPVE